MFEFEVIYRTRDGAEHTAIQDAPTAREAGKWLIRNLAEWERAAVLTVTATGNKAARFRD